MRLDYGAHAIVLEVPPAAAPVMEFLSAYLEPYFTMGDDDPAHPAVARARLHVGAPPAHAPDFSAAPVIAVDASKGFLRCDGAIVERNGIRWVELRPQGVTVRIDRAAQQLDLWGSTAGALRIPALRVVEDAVLNAVQRAGGVVLHASAVVVEGRALLAVGNKGAGKTSVLCHALHAFDVGKLANDNVCLLRQGTGEVVARGWPAFFKIGVATAAEFMELASDIPCAAKPALWDDDRLWAVYEKIALYPRQGAERFGAAVVPEAELGGIVFPRFAADVAPGLRRSSVEAIAPLMETFLQGVGNPNHREWLELNPVDPATIAPTLRALLADVASDLPVYELSWAPSLESLLGRIPELRRANKALGASAAASGRTDQWPVLPLATPGAARHDQPPQGTP